MQKFDVRLITQSILNQFFDSGTLERGKRYQKKGMVKTFEVLKEGDLLCSQVQGSGREIYQTEIELFLDERSVGEFLVRGRCSCYVAFNCKHVVATLYQVLHQKENLSSLNTAQKEKVSEVDHWLDTFSVSAPETSSKKESLDASLIYWLDVEKNKEGETYLEVRLMFSKHLKRGGFGKPKKFSFNAPSHQKILTPVDEEIIVALNFILYQENYTPFQGALYPLKGAQGSKCLRMILETGRCFLNERLDLSVALADAPLTIAWDVLPDATQLPRFLVDEDEVDVFFLEKPWYIDRETLSCGGLDTSVPLSVLQRLKKAPKIPPDAAPKLTQQLKTLVSEPEALLPKIFNEPILVADIKPVPELYLNMEEIFLVEPSYSGYYYEDEEPVSLEIPVVKIMFDYAGKKVSGWPLQNKKTTNYFEDGVLYSVQRDVAKEKECFSKFNELVKFTEIKDELHLSPNYTPPTDLLVPRVLETEEGAWDFSATTLPALEASGWRIFREHPFFTEMISDENVEWYSELDDSSGYDYFGLEMGIIIDGERTNILPFLSKFIREISDDFLKSLHDDDKLPLPVGEGKVLSVPYSRIKPIVNTLIELFDTPSQDDASLMLSKHQAALLFEIEKAFSASKLRWFGGDKLRALGEKLSEFKAISSVKIPKAFKASLREYQQNGVNWLQFLREYGMGGVLADDMGLGKTVQTLAHLSLEKSKGRMKKPSLIIAPTSLMVNWRLEAAKFTPNLKVLTFHGTQRRLLSDDIDHHDLVLTTYPLLVRDKEVLLSKNFYYLILDEAQCIKNSKTKTTQLVQQLKADHRLCLTGTPMENHLGELWSLFNFLMPGFLGDAKQFVRLFRTPIEKHNDAERRKALLNRTKPFMLRRTKDAVVKELPKKTEIIRTVEIAGPQRDLYESIRLSMEKKVREAISQKGLARSHIVILDALLKLRQTCCDPRLLKLDSAKAAHQHSAKMELLMDLLPNMVEEGRRILLFSQFTKMLALIEEALKEKGIDYVKLTGATRDRETPITSFQAGKVPVFLISLKAGGTGLNLTAADTVIHYDPWWNPAVEDQATDRAHRIGQDKSVFVYKLFASGTVEETIQEMQQKKRTLMEGLFSEQKGTKVKLSANDLDVLFKPLE